MGVGTVFSSLLAVLIALALVIALAWGSLYLIKKVQDRQLGVREDLAEQRRMQFIRAMPLGQRERIVLVEVGDKELLLGVTTQMITTLAEWPSGIRAGSGSAGEPPETSAPAAPAASSGKRFPAINFPPRPGAGRKG